MAAALAVTACAAAPQSVVQPHFAPEHRGFYAAIAGRAVDAGLVRSDAASSLAGATGTPGDGVISFFDVETREAWAFVGPFDTAQAAQAATRAGETHALLSGMLEIGDTSEIFVTELLATPGAAPPTGLGADIGDAAYYGMRTVRFPGPEAPRARVVLESYFLPTAAANGLEVLQFVRTDGGAAQIAFVGGYSAETAARESARAADVSWSAVLDDGGPPDPRESRTAFGGLKLDRRARVVATVRGAEAAPAPDASVSTETIVVQAGDTLSAISRRRYGTAGRVAAIVRANADVIANADLIFPGQVLRLP